MMEQRGNGVKTGGPDNDVSQDRVNVRRARKAAISARKEVEY
jgi:hypothetical protein